MRAATPEEQERHDGEQRPPHRRDAAKPPVNGT
jgi:hypothetical protein